eukprot:scaffold12246_cov16-Tisochrysis_lutea.AAC.6
MSACCPGPWRARDFICLPQGRGYRLHLGCMLAQMRGELNNWVQDTLNTQVIMCPVEPKGNHEHHAQGSQAIINFHIPLNAPGCICPTSAFTTKTS